MVIDYRIVLAQKARTIANYPDKVSEKALNTQKKLSKWMDNDKYFNDEDLIELLISK